MASWTQSRGTDRNFYECPYNPLSQEWVFSLPKCRVSFRDKYSQCFRREQFQSYPRQKRLRVSTQGPRKGRRHETSNKFKESQRVHCLSSLQDGRDSHPEGSGGLDDKSGSEGCILHDPNPRNRQISSLFLR